MIAKALEGVRAQYTVRECAAPEVLDIATTTRETQLKVGNTICRVRHPQGPETLAASVALPLLGIGSYVGTTAEDFFDLLRPATTATGAIPATRARISPSSATTRSTKTPNAPLRSSRR